MVSGSAGPVLDDERLAERLCGLSGLERAFFCNSGAEANEAAIKIARLHAHNRGIGNMQNGILAYDIPCQPKGGKNLYSKAEIEAEAAGLKVVGLQFRLSPPALRNPLFGPGS